MVNGINLEFVSSIMEAFSTDVSLEITIRQLSRKAGISYNAAHRTVKYLVKQGILEIRRFGRSSVVSLRPGLKATGLLCFAAYKRTERFLAKNKKAAEQAGKAVSDDSVKTAYIDSRGKVVCGKETGMNLSDVYIIKGAEAIFRKTGGGRK